jgi:hypothetical protein
MNYLVNRALACGILVVLPALTAQPPPRRPIGVYAVVNVQENSQVQQLANPSITTEQLKAYFINLYKTLLANPAVSGVALWIRWSELNPNPPSAADAYHWDVVDDAFSAAAAWNAANPSKPPKTIQLFPLPGFQTPQWVLDKIPSCDGLFKAPPEKPPADCGKMTVVGFVEGKGTRELPLPWNAVYKSAWRAFLTTLAARYGSNPALVSVSVAGPTASSEEMILPDNANTPKQEQFGGIEPNAMWLKLLQFHFPARPAYQRSDQAIIDEWQAAIAMYGQVFKGITLIATTGNGIPNLAARGFAVPAAFSGVCPIVNMDCATETTILSYFEQPTTGGPNAKAVQEDGLKASRAALASYNLGLDGIKFVARSTAQSPSPSGQVLGGIQFNSSFANFTLTEGCLGIFPPLLKTRPPSCDIPPSCTVQLCVPAACIPQACLAPGITQADLAGFATLKDVPKNDLLPPEQAAYNVLKDVFDETAVADAFGGAPGSTPMNYLQVYAADFLYAQAHAGKPAQVDEARGKTVSATAQDLLNLANQKIFEIAEPASHR